MLKLAEGSRNTFKKLRPQSFACRTEALAAVEQSQGKQAMLAIQAAVLVVPVYKGKGRQEHINNPCVPFMKSAVTSTRR
jgi:hypothetical protein